MTIAHLAGLSLAVLTWFIGLPGVAEGQDVWQCRNHEFEIGCDQTGCTASDAHTPMDISLSDTAISVCAYTGCWTGAPNYLRRGARFEIWTGYRLPFSTQASGYADISITLDTTTGVANVLVGDLYATPATCTVQASVRESN
ncbi:MAG: hypothetical protein QNI84_14545 [Henriciella sp.]|nr:hypothetical protein [Henriciella sp.]